MKMNIESLSPSISEIMAETDRGWIRLNENSSAWQMDDLTVEVDPCNDSVDINLQSPGFGVNRLLIRWELNTSLESCRILGDAWERGYGDLEWRSIAAERIMPWYVLISNAEGCFGAGLETGSAAMGFWQVEANAIKVVLDVRSGTLPVILAERRLKAATIRFASFKGSAYEGARELCKRLCPSPKLPQSTIYGGNNWYYAYGRSSHQEILDDANNIARWTQGNRNRPFMVIDDGWQLQWEDEKWNGGSWESGNESFPDMAGLASEIKAKEVRPGLWFRPLLNKSLQNNDLLLRRRGAEHVLDPSHPEVLDGVRSDISRFRAWGYELIKHDFSSFDIFGQWGFQMGWELFNNDTWFYSQEKTTAEIIRTFYAVIAEEAEDVEIIGCNTIGHLSAGLFSMQRTGDDTSGTIWERTRKMGINTLAFRMPQHETFFAADADCVGITGKIDWKYNSQWLDLLSCSGTPLFVSAGPKALTVEIEEALIRAFRFASEPQRPAIPLDWAENTVPARWLISGKEVKYSWDRQSGTDLGPGLEPRELFK